MSAKAMLQKKVASGEKGRQWNCGKRLNNCTVSNHSSFILSKQNKLYFMRNLSGLDFGSKNGVLTDNQCQYFTVHQDHRLTLTAKIKHWRSNLQNNLPFRRCAYNGTNGVQATFAITTFCYLVFLLPNFFNKFEAEKGIAILHEMYRGPVKRG